MGLSGCSGLTGGAGDFRRLLRVDESSKRRMASPWQFSPYLPSLSKCLASRSQWRRAVRHVFGRTALATVRDRDPEPALLEHMPMASRVCRSSPTIKMRCMTSSLAASDAACRRLPAKKGTAVLSTPGGFLPCESAHYRISAANCRPVCPLQCIRPVPQPDTVMPVNSCLRWRTIRRVVV
jgi:hypothetical protein